MAHTVIVHLMNEDPLLAETERLPEPGDVSMTLSSPRRRDGRSPQYLTQGVTEIILPMHRVSFIEVIPEEKEEEEEVVFYRD
jgi:hypothetical protein